MIQKLEGIITALITPFDQHGKIDFDALSHLIEMQIDAKINAILIGGSTGEGMSLSAKEYYSLLQFALKISNNRIPIIGNVNAANTEEAIKKIEYLNTISLSAIMCTMPHYIRPEQDGLERHFQIISSHSLMPIMIYLHPGRTSCDLSDATLMKLANIQNILAVKDASDDLMRPLRILPYVQQNNIKCNMLTGNDAAILSYYANGGVGCVSVISNIFPKILVYINKMLQSQKYSAALKYHQQLTALLTILMQINNPMGIKYAASKLALCEYNVRLPLTSVNNHITQQINELLPSLEQLEQKISGK